MRADTFFSRKKREHERGSEKEKDSSRERERESEKEYADVESVMETSLTQMTVCPAAPLALFRWTEDGEQRSRVNGKKEREGTLDGGCLFCRHS